MKYDKKVDENFNIEKDLSNPKRFTYLLGEGAKVKTATSRLTKEAFTTVKKIEEAFSVEPVNKEFYNGIKKLFDKIYKDVLNNFNGDCDNLPAEAPLSANETSAKEFSLRFLGRTLFCWFLREKDLIPKEIFDSPIFEEVRYNYYKEVLEELFFNVLNAKINERKIVGKIIKKYEKQIPFLNGGLFAKQKDDEINSLFSLKKEAEILEDEEKSWDIEYRNIYNKLKDNGELLEKIKNLKDNIFIRRERDFEGLLEIRRGEDGILAMLLKDSDMDYNIANIFKILKAEENEKPFSKSDKAERLIEQFERMQNIKKTDNKQDILIKLKKYKDMEFKISLSDREYIEKIIKAIEYNQLSKIQIKDIEKVFKNNRDIEILKGIKNIVDKNSLNSINYIEMDSWENSQLIVREEFSK